MGLEAPPRWDLVHARAVSAYAEILMHRRDAQKVLRKALRPEWPGVDETSGWAGDARGGGVNDAERAAIAEAVLGMEVNRLNLAWLVVDRARSAYEESLHAAGGIEAFGVDALEETLRGHADASRAEKTFSAETELDANVPLPRARYVAAASAMLDLHWMRERVVSNEFHRDRLAVLRGGAKIQGDAWPDAADAKLAVAYSVPKWFAARLIEERGVEGASALAAALKRKAPLTVRRNALKCDSNETLMRALAAEDVPAKRFSGSKETLSRGAPDALSFERGRPRLGIFGLETYRLGFFEVQDAGSQCIVSAVTQGLANTTRGARGETSRKKPLKVLDACCGNGGKTLALASSFSATLESQTPGDPDAGYRIDCFDVDARRLRHLVAATRRAGCENVTRVVTKLDLRAVAAANVEANKYDAVLVDAPCSSAGALRRFPSLRWEMEEFKTRLDVWDDADLDERGSEDSERRISDSGRFYDDSEDFSDGHDAIDGDVASASGRSDRTLTRSFPATQRRILRDAAALVRAGGVLVYATCSVLRSENEDVASWFEDAFAETFEPFAFPAGWPAADAENASSTTTTTTTHVVGLTPDAHGTDGFFIARWRRKR